MERFYGGEGGIRTREPLWVTRFPSVRAKPDYATSPIERRGLYQKLDDGLVIQRALVNPVNDQLNLRRGQLGSAFGHFLC